MVGERARGRRGGQCGSVGGAGSYIEHGWGQKSLWLLRLAWTLSITLVIQSNQIGQEKSPINIGYTKM